MNDEQFLRDLAKRIYEKCTPAMGFDQYDTDRLAGIALKLAHPAKQASAGEVPGDVLAGLRRAAATFREYERLHAAKGSIDGDAKARTNAREAQHLERLIAAHEQPPVDPLRGAVDDAFVMLPPEWTRETFVESVTNTLRQRGVTAEPK